MPKIRCCIAGYFWIIFQFLSFFSKMYKSMIYFWRRFVKSLSRYGNPSHLIFRLYASDLPQDRLPKTAFKCEGAEDGQSRPRTAFHIFILEIGGKYGIITAVIFRDMKKKFASPLCKLGKDATEFSKPLRLYAYRIWAYR